MSLGLNKILVTGVATNSASGYFQTTTVTSSTTGNGATVPAGTYLMFPSANVSVFAFDGTANSVMMAANVGGVLLSDGTNVYLKSSAGNANVTLITVNGGLAANGTYNS